MPTSSNSDDLPWADLGRWLAGEMSADQATAMERWVASDPHRAATVAALREAWMAAGAAGEGWDAAAAVRRVREATAAEARVIARLGGRGAVASPSSRWTRVALAARVAAALAVVAGGAFVAERASRPAVEAPAPATLAEYRTPRGQRLALRLADGTQVMLAPGSVLRRPSDYGRRERRLELEGEAYFVVTHDAARPFTVHTSRLVARDLGTRFDVRAYPDESTTDVLVAEGKVAVGGAVLTAGQLARRGAAGDVAVRSGADVARLLAWTDGRLVFADTPLQEVERQLERWYDVDVRLASADLGRLRVTGAFEDEPVTEVLEAAARSLDLAVRRVGGVYELSRGGK
jgi:transmembrane sensor